MQRFSNPPSFFYRQRFACTELVMVSRGSIELQTRSFSGGASGSCDFVKVY